MLPTVLEQSLASGRELEQEENDLEAGITSQQQDGKEATNTSAAAAPAAGEADKDNFVDAEDGEPRVGDAPKEEPGMPPTFGQVHGKLAKLVCELKKKDLLKRKPTVVRPVSECILSIL